MNKILIIMLLVFVIPINLFSQENADTIKASYNDLLDISLYVLFNTELPASDKSGIVSFKFKVTKEGCIDSIAFMQSPDKAINKAITETLNKTACDWKPATCKDIAVDSWQYSELKFESKNY
jgi:hypothetical protein